MSKNQKYQKNIFFLTIHLMFSKRLTGPVMMLLYQFYGLNYGQIGALSALAWFSDAAFEIFGGAFSDVYGRKNCSMLYAILGMASMLIFALGNSFIYFALGNITYGVALAIGSGNASALLFDTLKILKLEKSYKKYRGQIQLPPKILNGLSILILPFLYLRDIKYPFALGFVFYLISFLTALFFLAEPPKKKSIEKPQMLQTILKSLREIASNNKVLFIIAFQIVWGGFILLFFEYFQPIIKIAHVPLAYFGLVYFAARTFEGLGSALIHKFERHSNRKLIFYNILMLLASLIGFALAQNIWLILIIMLGCIADGVADVLQSELLNNNISTANRTTIMSTANVGSSLFIALSLFVFGHLSDKVGVQSMFGYAASAFLILLGILFTVLRIGNFTSKLR